MICVVAHCDHLDAATEFEIYPPEPAAEILCFEHYRELVRKRTEAQQTALLARRRVEILSLPKMTCYGDGGRCPNEGAPFAGGPYCPEHAPDPFAGRGMDPDAVARALPAVPAVKPDEPTQEPEPLLKAVACPEDKMPGSVKSAVKRAVKHGWAYRVNLAISPEPDVIHSVTFTASKDDVTLSSRHEGDDIAVLRFKTAWHQIGSALPIAIQWRELTAALEGTDPHETDKRRMRQAVLDVMDIGGTVVEINGTG